MNQLSTIKRQDIIGLDAGLSLVSGSPQERFFQTLVDYFVSWSAVNATLISAGRIEPDRALLMIYSESPKLEPGIPAAVIVTEEVVYAALNTLSNGVAVAGESLSEVIQLVPHFKAGATEAMNFVKKHLRADQSFALLMLGQSRILVHESGVPIEDWVHKQRVINIKQIPNADITPEMIGQQLDEFHNDALSTHRGSIARLMWEIREEPKLSVFKDKPELHVQSGLLLFFRGIYREKVAVVDEEVSLNEGRVDVRIVRFDKTGRRLITMIELKVLDPSGSDPANLAWAHKGIQQAHDYKKSNYTDAAFACIYDARRSKGDQMPTLQPDAVEKDVLLKVLPMEVPAPRPRKKSSGDAADVKPVKVPRVATSAKKSTINPAAKKRAVAKTSPKKT